MKTILCILIATCILFGQTGCDGSPESKPAQPDEKPADVEKTKTTYTCPMHPEVTADKPGKCPKCKMDLVESPAPEKQSSTGTIYTCPMHHTVALDKPGKCPFCNMDLVEKKQK